MLRSTSSSDWRRSPAHLVLLSQFAGPREDFRKGTLGGQSWEDWQNALAESPRAALKRLLEDGALEQASLADCVAHKFTVSYLKALLSQRGLSVSGRKADLVERLIQADRKAMQYALSGLTLLQCTQHGREIVEEHLARERQQRAALEQKMLGALRRRDFRGVVDLRISFEAEQVFPRGMGVDWRDYGSRDRDAAMLKTIFTQKPKVLAQLNDEQLEPLRLAAGMFVLGWNVGRVSAWLPDDLATGLQMSNNAAAMQLWSYARHLQEMQEARIAARESLLRYVVHVSTCGDNLVCEACRELASRVYELVSAPVLPYEKCTSKEGCRCWCSAAPTLWTEDELRKMGA